MQAFPDIKCLGKEQTLRYAVIQLDIADNAREDFDELIIEVRGSTVWVHFSIWAIPKHLLPLHQIIDNVLNVRC